LSADRRHILDRHKIVDFAFKAVGIGSVGTFCLVALLMTGDNEPSSFSLNRPNDPYWNGSVAGSRTTGIRADGL
jgi:uncharacterized protein DUF2252